MVDEAQKVSPDCDNVSYCCEALTQSLDLPQLAFTFSLSPLPFFLFLPFNCTSVW